MLLTALLTSKAAAAAVGAVVVAGTAAAAVTVPAALGHASDRPSATASDDETATDDTSSPAADESTESESADDPTTEAAPTESASQGPDATGPAAFGLCTAWAHGGLSYAKAEKGNPAAAALVDAAGDGTVEDYCTAVMLEKKGTPSPSETEATDEDADAAEPGSEGRSKGAAAKAEHGKPDKAGKPSGAGMRP